MIGEREAQLRAAVSALRSDELLRFLARQRWFGAKGSTPTHAHIVDVIPLRWSDGAYGIARVNVRDVATEREYQLPIGLRDDAPIHRDAVITKIDQAGRSLTLYDAVYDPVFRATLAEALAKSAVVGAGAVKWVVDVIRPGWSPDGEVATTVGSAEQSNTSIVIGDRAIYKLFRALTPGVHPDVEVTRFLTTTARFPNTRSVQLILAKAGNFNINYELRITNYEFAATLKLVILNSSLLGF